MSAAACSHLGAKTPSWACRQTLLVRPQILAGGLTGFYAIAAPYHDKITNNIAQQDASPRPNDVEHLASAAACCLPVNCLLGLMELQHSMKT